MNLKKSLMGAVAGLALIGSIAGPVVAGENGDTANATITVLQGGVFDLTLTDLSFGSTTLTANDVFAGNPSYTGSLDMTYTDTKASRGGFTTRLSATDFHGTYNNSANTIPVSNFLITYLPNPVQELCCWGSNGVSGISNVLKNNGSIPGTSTSAADWAPGVSFGDNPFVHISDFGKPNAKGTGHTYASATVKLTVPSSTAQDDYLSVITATVSFTAP